MDVQQKDVSSFHAIAELLGAGIDRRMMLVLLEMLEFGVHPESLAQGVCSIALICRFLLSITAC